MWQHWNDWHKDVSGLIVINWAEKCYIQQRRIWERVLTGIESMEEKMLPSGFDNRRCFAPQSQWAEIDEWLGERKIEKVGWDFSRAKDLRPRNISLLLGTGRWKMGWTDG